MNGHVHVLQTMYRATWTPEEGWQGSLEPYQPLQLEPAAQVLNYGQSIFEGLKAQRSAKGRIVLFRPWENAARMAEGMPPPHLRDPPMWLWEHASKPSDHGCAGADRLEMPPPPADLFMEAVTDVVRANVDFVPPHGKGSLYLRPLLLGSGPILGLGSAPSFTFLIFCAAVGAYFKVPPSILRATN